MSSIWNNNIQLFSKRFPALTNNLNLLNLSEPEFTFWEVFPSKAQTLTARENGIYLHSAYNPVREAQSAVQTARTENIWCGTFFGIGLGYGPVEWAKKFPDDTIIITEPSLDYFFAALKYTDLTPVFMHKNLVLTLQAGIDEVTSLIEKTAGFSHTAIIENKAQSAHAADYFDALHNLIERNKRKVQINNWTLEKFSKLWLKNSCRNIKNFAGLDGVNLYKDKCPENLPALLVSAGPTLSAVLPYLKELKKRCIIIAVDTALRACLKAGVDPDFILLVDPQYYAWRHIAGLKSPSSVLITESAAYPSAFRFKCRKTILCSSLFPLGQYFEKRLGQKGELGAGGSVSTTAWDFARLTGAKEIFCAGLDLGYPKLESHIRGSLFEEAAHRKSSRILSSEKFLACSLFGANSETARDYAGNSLCTDDKMKMFAWWFESKNQEYSSIKSYSLSEKSLAIPGFSYISPEELLLRKENTDLRQKFFSCEHSTTAANSSQEAFKSVYSKLLEGFDELYSLAKKGLKTAEDVLSQKIPSPEKINQALKTLEQTDNAILHSDLKEAASLVFPTENKLNAIFQETIFPQDPQKALFMRYKIIYRELKAAISQYQNYF